ncbi:MAG: helix-turn-helix transcriptional regulator [Oscillospiraceae bacterium]|nr:helix-turn-helix transcriptional regulator [Oscillospiraceae bacterium]
MEFHEKLQQLRRQHDLTQEQLAEKLFVSRTAISKWESGRGYPNLESLKSLSKLFGLSLDKLLSSEELLEAAETENRSNLRRVSAFAFAALDIMVVALLFLPLFGQQEGDYIRAVTLWRYTAVSGVLRGVYVLLPASLAVIGIVELVLQRYCKCASVVLHAAAVLFFALSRQPYMTALLFLLLMVKVALLIQENRIQS